jgi:LEA14-like dessication related protein
VYKPWITREKPFKADILRFFMQRLLIIGVLADGLLCSGCVTTPIIEKPQLELAGLRIDRMSLHDPQLGLILRARNPNRISIPLKQVDVAVELNERAFAEGHSTQAVTLPAQGTALVELVVHAHGDVLWTSVKDMIHAPGGTLRYRIRGSAVISGLDMHFDFDTPGMTDFDTLLGRNRSNQPRRE